MEETREKLEERFWSKVNPTTGIEECWEWLGSQTGPGWDSGKGYGSFSFAGKMVPAHRFSYELVYGPIPEGMFILHSCDNKPCVNPRHLSVGTASQNTLEMWERNLHRIVRSNVNLTQEQASEIRKLYATGLYSQTLLGEQFGVTSNVISHLVLGKTWKDLDGPIAKRVKPRLDTQKVEEIRFHWDNGMGKEELITKYKVSRRTIERIVKREVFKNL